MALKNITKCLVSLAAAVLAFSSPVHADEEIPEGWLLWHSYSDYSALDSSLYLRSPEGEIKEITGDFIHAMNGSFGNRPGIFTFMAIDEAENEWDVFMYQDGVITNLTKGSGCRNEDPKFLPDGKTILFKRGHWDSSFADFAYDLVLLEPATGSFLPLTETPAAEEAMPCCSADGKYVYYAGYNDGIGSIYSIERSSGQYKTIFSEKNVSAYYPIAYGNDLFFTKWYSADNHSDQLMKWDGETLTSLPFDSKDYDCSDACPLGGDRIIFSSTMNGEGYDLYYFDGSTIFPITELNTGRNELGASFFPVKKAVNGDVDSDGRCSAADLVLFQKWLLGMPDIELQAPDAADLFRDGTLDTYDICRMRKLLTEN